MSQDLTGPVYSKRPSNAGTLFAGWDSGSLFSSAQQGHLPRLSA
jgi:hypothetical protein